MDCSLLELIMHKVVVVGAAVIDVLISSKALKVVKGHNLPGGVAMCEMIGGKIEGEDGQLETGGGGTNVSVGLRRLGEAVKLISRVGDDIPSNLVMKEMENELVDISLLQRGKGKTGLSAILVASDGGRSIVTYRGESAEIEEKDIDWEEIKKADWLQISSLGGNIDLLEDLLTFALNNGIRIGVNPGKGELTHRDRLMKILPKFDFFNVNRMEASILLEHDFDDEKGLMIKMADSGVRLLAVTDGKRGASMMLNRRWIKMDAFPNKSVDDTGAGDAFVSGVVRGILDNRNLEDIVKLGLANGGSVVTKLGAKAGLIYTNDIDKWLKKKLKMTEEWV